MSAIVHLPRSLVALFPGAERRTIVEGTTVLQVIEALDQRHPGFRDRLVDAGPSLRAHINVYVAGGPADLTSAVPAGAIVHVIPAVSGGSVTSGAVAIRL